VTSKFSGLKAMREKRQADQEAPPPEPAPTRRVGRPAGKRSDPNYQQVTVLLHGETYKEVRKRLLDEKKEVSTLLNELLDAWLKG
jgi:hypothetical protein